MWEKQILARAIGIQEEKWEGGGGGPHIFLEIIKQQ